MLNLFQLREFYETRERLWAYAAKNKTSKDWLMKETVYKIFCTISHHDEARELRDSIGSPIFLRF